MSASAPEFGNPLDAATSQMRNLSRDHESLPPSFNHGSLDRILVHIENISRSVTESTQDHVNAAKRLNDFALIFARLAKDSEPSNGALAERMTSVSDNLRSASEELSGADAIPKWRAPERARS